MRWSAVGRCILRTNTHLRSFGNNAGLVVGGHYPGSHAINEYTFMQVPEYRIGVGEMTQGHIQSAHTSFYVGSDMGAQPTPRLATPAGT